MAADPETGGKAQPQALAGAALDCFAEYERAGDRLALSRAVPLFRAALASAERSGAPDIPAYYNNLAYALHVLAAANSDAAAQAESVGYQRAAVAATPPEDLDRVPYLCTLVSGLRDLYHYTRDAELLREAVSAGTEAVRLPGFEPSRATQYSLLGSALGDLYGHRPDPAVLTDLIAAYRQAASYAELPGGEDPAPYWNSVGAWLQEHYERTGEVGSLTLAVQSSRKAVAASSGDTYLSYLSNLGYTLRLLFERTGDLDALAESVAASRTAVAGTWPGNPDLPRRANHLAGALATQYKRTGDAAGLAEAVTAARQAVAAAGPSSTERGGYLNNLEAVLEFEWERTGTLATLWEAVSAARDAVAAAPPGHELRALCLTALASAVSELHERTGNDELLTEAVQASRDALAAADAGSRDRALYSANLAEALAGRFKRSGDTAALHEAISVARAAIAATPDDAPALAQRLASLSALLGDLGERSGDVGPLTEAVAIARQAVAAAPLDDPSRAVLLDDLGSALTGLFPYTRNSALLAEAVRVGEEALAATPDGHISRPIRLTNLAASVQALATRTAERTLVTEAADLLERALQAVPEDDPGRALCLHNLAKIYLALLQYFPEPELGYLDDAIQYARDSVTATPADHADYPGRLATLSWLLVRVPADTESGRVPAIRAEAVRLARQALAATAPDDSDYARHQDQLGWALFAHHQAGGEAADLTEAWQCFYDAARQPIASVSLRIGAYRRAAELATRAGRTPLEALACIEAAVDLLPGVLPGQLDRADQEHEISSVQHLAAHAAETAVTAGQPGRAVELLERTRGVLVANELDRRAGHDHDRRLTVRELGDIASAGPVVYIYAGAVRCDALIVMPGPDSGEAGRVRVVPLGLAEADVWDQVEQLGALVGIQPLDKAPDPNDASAQQEISAALGWIREHVTGPVLAALGFEPSSGRKDGLPRIWWCPVGVFAFLPLHAACMDEVVSSYAFTARSLAYARSQPPVPAGAADSPLIVAVPDAPGAWQLRGAEREADLIASAFPRALRLKPATKGAVLAALPGHPVAHFACHGRANVDEPGRSQLILQDHADAPLTVADIGALQLTGGLAFLSACVTAVTSADLSNEAVHMAGAFQLAGYQHVVGTLWQVEDLAAARLVGAFYSGLTTAHPPGRIDVSRAAVALHQATCELRHRYPNQPVLWAGHIHTGP